MMTNVLWLGYNMQHTHHRSQVGSDSTVASALDGRSHSGSHVLHEERESIQGFLCVNLLLLWVFGLFSHSTGHKNKEGASCNADPATIQANLSHKTDKLSK